MARRIAGSALIAVGLAAVVVGGIIDAIVTTDGVRIYGLSGWAICMGGFVIGSVGLWVGGWIDSWPD